MKPQIHATVGFGGGLLLYRFWDKVEGIFFFLGSVLLDVDHFIDFIWRTKCKNLNIKYIVRATSAFVEAQIEVLPNRKDALSFFMFHSVEFLLLVGLSSIFVKSEFLSSALMGIFWGAMLHILLDVIDNRKKRIQKAWFLVEYVIRRHSMRKKGIDPDGLFKKILKEMQQSTKKT